MPIITDKKRMSFETVYEHQNEDGQVITLPIKYLYGTYGPTVQIFFGGDNGGVELPADMFADVANWLASYGVGIPTPQFPQFPQQQQHVPTAGGKALQVPLLKRATPGMGAAQVYPPQSMNPLAPQRADVNPLNLPPSEEVPSLSNEEIMAQRTAAIAKAKNVDRFKKGHVEGAYVPPPRSASSRAAEAANQIAAEHNANK